MDEAVRLEPDARSRRPATPARFVRAGGTAMLIVLALALADCGKKGPPQPPPDVPHVYPRSYPRE